VDTYSKHVDSGWGEHVERCLEHDKSWPCESGDVELCPHGYAACIESRRAGYGDCCSYCTH
jgi:hypothetical protein